MEDAVTLIKLFQLLGIHATGALVGFSAAWIMWRRNQDLQRRLFKLANAQVQAANKLEVSLDALRQAIRNSWDRDRLGGGDRDNR